MEPTRISNSRLVLFAACALGYVGTLWALWGRFRYLLVWQQGASLSGDWTVQQGARVVFLTLGKTANCHRWERAQDRAQDPGRAFWSSNAAMARKHLRLDYSTNDGFPKHSLDVWFEVMVASNKILLQSNMRQPATPISNM
eukprot:1636544-Pleurochrysis_carterae.AAC.2